MEIKNIAIEKGKPVRVLVELDFDVAVYLAVITGNKTDEEAERDLPGAGAHANCEIYECLTGELFNRFYSGGFREALRHVGE